MHQLISSSDFPEPVVPATMACGPDDAIYMEYAMF